MKARTGGKGDVRVSSGRSGPTAGGSPTSGSGERSSPALGQTTADVTVGIRGAALCELLMRDDGWLRAIPDGEGKTAYLKWKFSRGRFAGHYVMVVIHPVDYRVGFTMLWDKIEDCYTGHRRPTKDRDYVPIIDDGFPD